MPYLPRVHRRSEGNPFDAAELYSAETRGGGLDRSGLDPSGGPAELPSMLADLLLSRVERLSDAGRWVVRVAAVAGRRVDDELVRRVSGLDEAAAGEALREVVSHQLLVPAGTGYTFRHALLREAVYADLLPGERTRLHAAFARLLADPPEGTRGSAAELAHHSLAAHDLPAAFAASVRAGREAARLGAPAEASEHYERALELWDAVPGPEAAAGTDLARLTLAAAEASAASGELRRAAQRLRRLLDTAEPADAALGCRIRGHLATCSASSTTCPRPSPPRGRRSRCCPRTRRPPSAPTPSPSTRGCCSSGTTTARCPAWPNGPSRTPAPPAPPTPRRTCW